MSTILVVDDQPEIRQMYRTVLRRCGYDVIVAATGNEALAALESEFPDLVLLDLAMPGMDGVAFLDEVRRSAQWAKLPVILITAFSVEGQVELARKIGATDHIVKANFSIKELRSLIARYVSPPPQAMAG